MAKQVWDDPRITAYVLGELNGNERVAFERLLDQDAELQQAVNEAERVKREVGSFLQASPVPSLSASQKARVEQAIEGNYNPVAKSSQPVTPAGSPAATERRWSGMLSLAVSAVIVAGIGAAVLLVGPGRDLVAFRAESDAALNVSSEAPQTATRAQTSQSTDSQADKKTADVAAAASELSFSPEANAAPKDQSAVDSLGVPPIAVPGEPPMAKVAADAAPTTSLADAPTAPAEGGEFQRGSGAPNSRARPFELPQDPSPAALVPPAPMSAAIPSPAPLPPGAPGPAPSTAAAPIAGGARGLGSEASGMLPAGGPVNGPDRVAVGRDGFSGGALGGGGLGTLPADGLEEGEAKPGLPMTAESRLNADEDFTKATPSRGGLRAEGKLAEPQQEAARTKLLQKKETDQGTGPGSAGDRFQLITDNPFVRVNEAPLSTFSVDVDTASYSKVRQYLLEAHTKPRPDAVRIEELVNYFDYEYKAPEPKDPHPFAVHVQVAPCPWNNEHQLARIAIKGRELEGERPRSNLVFLVDTSGSMNEPNKLPLVVRGLRMLVSQLNERDRVAIVVYAGSAGLVLDSTPGDRRDKLLDALDRLAAGGSTDGGSGIRLAYDVARENFIEGGTNRVILCTDGDFNVGTTGTDELVRLVEEQAKAKIFLTTLGFGWVIITMRCSNKLVIAVTATMALSIPQPKLASCSSNKSPAHW